MIRAPIIFAITLMAVSGSACTATSDDKTGDTKVAGQTEDTSQMSGMSYDDAVTRLGQPAKEETFTLTPGVYEFRIELLNFYDSARLERDPPEVREVTWSVSASENLTLWFVRDDGEWRVLHQSRWDPDSEF